MSDPVDVAQVREEELRSDALALQARHSGLVKGDWRKLSAKWCERPACGVRIPDERRRAMPGVKFCVDCKTREEKEQQRRKR